MYGVLVKDKFLCLDTWLKNEYGQYELLFDFLEDAERVADRMNENSVGSVVYKAMEYDKSLDDLAD